MKQIPREQAIDFFTALPPAEAKVMREGKEKVSTQHTIGNWQLKEINLIHQVLEQPNWAPWLAASPNVLKGRAEVFPEGQLIIKSIDGEPLASLSMNRINWDDDIETLPSWDNVAGSQSVDSSSSVLWCSAFPPSIFCQVLQVSPTLARPDTAGPG